MLKEIDVRDWRSEVLAKPKLRTYKLFKTELQPELYTISFISKRIRSCLAKLRCGVLPLKVESGRFVNLKLHERICEFCTLNCIEDELHFTCVCPFYSTHRTELYNSITIRNPYFTEMNVNDKFVYLMTKEQIKTSKFVWKCYEHRSKSLFT